jgi:hypothetical protein
LRIFEKTLGPQDPRYRETLADYARLLRLNQRPKDADKIEARVNALR